MSCSTRRIPIPSRSTTPERMAANCSVSPTSNRRASPGAARPGGRRAVEGAVAEGHGPRRRRVQAGAGVERRGLPGAVGADQTGDDTAPGPEGDVVDRHQPAEADDKAVD